MLYDRVAMHVFGMLGSFGILHIIMDPPKSYPYYIIVASQLICSYLHYRRLNNCKRFIQFLYKKVETKIVELSLFFENTPRGMFFSITTRRRMFVWKIGQFKTEKYVYDYSLSIIDGSIRIGYGKQDEADSKCKKLVWVLPWTSYCPRQVSVLDFEGEIYADATDYFLHGKDTDDELPTVMFEIKRKDATIVQAYTCLTNVVYYRQSKFFNIVKHYEEPIFDVRKIVVMLSDPLIEYGLDADSLITIDAEKGELHREAFKRFCHVYNIKILEGN